MSDKFIVTSKENGLRLDKALVSFLEDRSRNYILKLIDSNLVTVNKEYLLPSYKVKENDVIEINELINTELEVKKEDIPLDIVYEDDDILIINKPKGMVTHPAVGNYEHTLVNALMYHCHDLSGINGVLRPGIVHRLDKDTSGLLVVAKNDKAHNFLANQLLDHTMHRSYLALVNGIIMEDKGEINLPTGRNPNNRLKMMVSKTNSKEAITYFKVLERFNKYTLVECNLKTGRTHQIRVHMSYIGHPVEGDPLYCNKTTNKLYHDGQLLVAYKLTLIHPTTHEEMTFKIDIPDYFNKVLTSLRKK